MAKRKNKRNKTQNAVNIIATTSIPTIPTLEDIVINDKTLEDTVNIVDTVENINNIEIVKEEVKEEKEVVEVIAPTKAPTSINTDRAKSFLQNVQEKQIEQIHDWLDSIEESMLLTKNILNNTTNNKEESFALKRIQKLYHQLNLIKNIKKGKTVIMGFNKKKLNH